MLSIIYKNGQETRWYIGNKTALVCPPNEVVSISADGHELMLLKTHLKNFPFHDGAVMVWYGDFAKMIAHFIMAQ